MERSPLPYPARNTKRRKPSQADSTLHIAPVELEIAPGKRIKTTGYNGSVPGPILRMTEGKPVAIDVYNQTGILSWFIGTDYGFPLR